VSAPLVPPPPGAPLLVEDLRLTLADIGPLFERAVEAGDEVDSFLLAAGASQILRDELEDDPARLLRAAAVLKKTGPDRFNGAMTSGAALAAQAVNSARGARSSRRELAGAAGTLDAALGGLARGVYSKSAPEVSIEVVRRVLAQVSSWDTRFGSPSVRQPSCFRSFDQHPRDMQVLAKQVLSRWPDGTAELVVVGVRTSGSYLAPLLAAALQGEGGVEVPWVTVRPGHPVAPPVRDALCGIAKAGGRLLIVDDPPGTGSSLARVGSQLEALGAVREQVCMTLALLDQGSLPAPLLAYESVLLEWPNWDIHRRLGPEAVRAMLDEQWRGTARIDAIRSFVLPAGLSARGHMQVGYHVDVVTSPSAQRTALSLVAEGSGLGYFGRHVVALSQALPGLVPDVMGFRDGVTLRQWLPDESRIPLDSEARVREAVHYVTRRRAALPARRDAATAMAGQQPAWEVASRLLAAPYGPIGLAMRSGGLDAAVRTLLAPRIPSVVDGQTGSRAWFEDDGALLKVSFADRAFSNLDLACYDAAYDVAGLALGTSTPALAAVARAEFESSTGVEVDPERWLLYRIVHLWDRLRLGHIAPDVSELAMSEVWQDWVSKRLLGGPRAVADGPFCTLDVDGVLESSRLGPPVLTPSAAHGLMALLAHGYRPLLATGRSLAEVRSRCQRFELLGGVAEYGCVAYDHQAEVVSELAGQYERDALDDARQHLDGLGGVRLAQGFHTALRAYRVDGNRRRVALDPDEVRSVERASGGLLCAHQGIAQTDFVPTGISKADGIARLMELLGAPGEHPAFAVGDSDADLTMLRMAQRGYVPSHSSRLAHGSIIATRRSYQRGFAEAVGTELTHEPGSCPTCAPSHAPSGAALIASLLCGLEGGRERGLALVPEILRDARRVVRDSRTTQP